MTRVLCESELREILDLLIPIIRSEVSGKKVNVYSAPEALTRYSNRAKDVWKLLTYEDYAGELV